MSFLLLIILSGCSGSGERYSTGGCAISNVTSPDSMKGRFVFHACAMDSPASQDSVMLLMMVENRSIDAEIVGASFDYWLDIGIDVRDPRGSIMEPEASWEPWAVREEYINFTRFILPIRGVIGQMLDLTCAVPDYSGITIDSCLPLYSFDEAGKYQVTIKYPSVVVCSPPCRRDDPAGVPPEQTRVRFEPVRLDIEVVATQ
jgi:hypothetical protein